MKKKTETIKSELPKEEIKKVVDKEPEIQAVRTFDQGGTSIFEK